ncbi:MAG: hypothetical protein RJA11_1683, partial [Bacteroidota bacterium]
MFSLRFQSFMDDISVFHDACAF